MRRGLRRNRVQGTENHQAELAGNSRGAVRQTVDLRLIAEDLIDGVQGHFGLRNFSVDRASSRSSRGCSNDRIALIRATLMASWRGRAAISGEPLGVIHGGGPEALEHGQPLAAEDRRLADSDDAASCPAVAVRLGELLLRPRDLP